MTLDNIILSINNQIDINVSLSRNHGSSHGLSRCILKDETGKKYILKYTTSSQSKPQDQIKEEANALVHFESIGVRTPLYSELENIPAILMNYVESATIDENDLSDLVTHLHSEKSEKFGYDTDNYIASIPLNNTLNENWAEFYWRQRIKPLLRKAIEENNLPASYLSSEVQFIRNIEKKVPDESPALIHGDLWNGNYIVDASGKAYLIDPAAYYGHREMDIGMSKLFGGFSQNFYKEYEERLPLEKGWEKRVPIFQLYYLLVHVVLFGSSYSSRTKNAWEYTMR